MFIKTYEHSPAQCQSTAAPIRLNVRNQGRKLMQNNSIKKKQPRTTANGGYRSKLLAPVMVKPPPTTNTFPVEKI
jgi:hypothetical protein